MTVLDGLLLLSGRDETPATGAVYAGLLADAWKSEWLHRGDNGTWSDPSLLLLLMNGIRLRSITTKIIAVALAGCATVGAALGGYLVRLNRAASERSIDRLDQVLRENFDRLAQSQTETAASVLRGIAAKRDRGEITPDEARKLAADLLRGMRYGAEGYFWADTPEGVNVVLLGRDTEGKSRIDKVDGKGNHYMRDIIGHGLAGGGFSHYWFPKKNGGTPFEKRTYSVLVLPFGWVIGTGTYLDEIEALVTREREAAKAAAARQLWFILLIVAGAMGLATALAASLGRILSRPIVRLTAGMDRMAEGDFTSGDGLERLADSSDETGKMARSLLAMRASMGEMARGAQQSAETIAAASRQMQSTAQNMAAGAAEQASAVQQTMASLAEIEQTASRAQERATAVIEATSRSESLASAGGNAIARVRKEMEALGTQVNAIGAATGGLAQKAMEIDTIAAKVKDLAEQSHVLALNASIEASHVGEEGKGFAVVAAEVKQLSAQSLQASLQVKHLVGEIQAASRLALAAAEVGGRRASEAIGMSRTTDEALAGLSEVVRDSVTAAKEIAESILRQDVGVERVSQAMTEVSRVAATTAERAQDAEKASSALAGQSSSLREAIGRVRT